MTTEITIVLTPPEADALCQILDATLKARGLEFSVGVVVIFQKLQIERARIEKEAAAVAG